jgi:pimeloyl-ACP methyl ester carboxylesterase
VTVENSTDSGRIPIVVEPVRFDVSDEVLEDLRARLARTRWPVAPEGAAWAHGTSLPWMQEVVAHWLEAYDWRTWEARINAFDQVLVDVGRGRIHAIVERGSGESPLPLILTHGWPGSFGEFLQLVEPLAHPERFGGREEEAFTVVVPNLYGVGYSDAPPGPVSPREVGSDWHALMGALGFDRFVAHGGDWGAAITSWLAFDHPGSVAAIHLTMALLNRDPADPLPPLSEEEQAYLAEQGARMIGETGYQEIHGTKPLSLGYAMVDSPSGLAAWILEKFQSWSASYGTDRPPDFPLDDLITNVMLHWLNGSNASCWMYRFMVEGTAFTLPPGGRVETPTGLCLFPDDVAKPGPPSLAQRAYNVCHRSVASTGSHFPGLDAANALTDDIRLFLHQYRDR